MPSSMGWGEELRRARRSARLSRQALASLADVSTETIKGYELGTRHPKAQTLDRLLDVLHVERVAANRIREAAGFAVDRTWLGPAGPRDWWEADNLAEAVERRPWPIFVVNDRIDIVAANLAFQALAGVDLSRDFHDPYERNLLMFASDPRYGGRIENWDEAVGILIAVWKGHYFQPASVEAPSPLFGQLLEKFAAGDPGYVARFVKLWDEVQLLPNRKRWEYPVRWRDEELGELRFLSIVVTGDEPEVLLSFNEWIPLDGSTWERLEEIKARHSEFARR